MPFSAKNERNQPWFGHGSLINRKVRMKVSSA